MKLCIKKKGNSLRIRYDLEKRQNTVIANRYKELLETNISQINKDETDMTKLLSDIEKMIYSTSTTIGKFRKKNQP